MADITPTANMSGVQRGLIGWFDILGYKNIIENNTTAEAVLILEKIRKIIEDAAKSLNKNQAVIGQQFCSYLLFSDTILLHCVGSGHVNAAFFTEFSSELVNNFFWAGLPVRGAWAFGDFYVASGSGSISLAGRPIVEAYKFADRIDLSGCVLAPSAEMLLVGKDILDSSSTESLGFIRQRVPLKGLQNQELFMLNHYAMDLHYNPERQISRQTIMEKFAEHRKHIDAEVLPKVNNTLEFLRRSKPSTATLPGE